MANKETDKPDPKDLESLVEQARSGIRYALEELVRTIQDQVFGLSMRMLGHRPHAEDATQEILVKVITHLDSFRAESRFTAWVYAVAANHLRQYAGERHGAPAELVGRHGAAN